MSWGKAIIVIYAVFVTGIAVMVYTSMTKETELVTKNYYEKELKYQEQIDKLNNSNEQNKNLKIEAKDNMLIIIFPDDELGKNISGEVSFYRPSDAKSDFSIPVDVNSTRRQAIATDKLKKGLWKIMVNWNDGNVNYYKEEKVMIQ